MTGIILAALLAAGPDQGPAGAQREQGMALFRQGRVKEAIAKFEEAVKLNPADAVAWYNLAYASRKAQKFERAAEAYQKYTLLSPDDPDGYFGLAESLRNVGRKPEAVEAYTNYISKEKRASEQKWVQQAKARVAELSGDAAAASSAPTATSPSPSTSTSTSTSTPTATSPSPSTPTSTSTSTSTLTTPSASTIPSTSASTTPSTSASTTPSTSTSTSTALTAAAVARGDKAFATRDYRVALFAYQDAIMASPDDVPSRVRAGRAYEKLGHDDEAMDQWSRVLQLDPANTEARELLAAARERRAALPPAAAQQLAQHAPPQPAQSRPAQPQPAQPQQTQPQPAQSRAPAVTPADDAVARAHYRKAVQLIRERKYDEGAAELDLALAAKPGFAIALVARGSARIGQGRHQDALADYAAAQKADPSLASPLFGLAEAYRGLGQKEKAVQLYRQYAASTAPDAQQSLKQYALDNAQALSQ